jgi:hypothetical protein
LFRVAVTEANGQFGNPEEEERPPLEAWKPLPSSGSEDVSVDNFLCVAGNQVTNPNPVYRWHKIEIGCNEYNKYLENVPKFKYMITTKTIDIHKDI